MVIDALRGHYQSKDPPQTLAMAQRGYWYHAAAMKLDKYDAWRSEIQNAFRENNRYHGYHQHLKDSGKLLSEKDDA